jgi:hypothetical protein
LVCPAAPEIGCGSRSKPILLDLEKDSTISEAWLNSAGTVLAVVGAESSSRESRAKAVHQLLEKKSATATELNTESREQQLKSFLSGAGWYRGAEVDNLSKQEAGIIADRLVGRIRAKVAMPDDQAKALATGLADVYKRRFTGGADNSKQTSEQQKKDELLKVAREHLDEKGVAAFQEAIAKGYQPGPNEK